MEMFGSSGARGVATTELTPELVVELAGAAGSVWGGDRVALARDTRTSGELYRDAAAAGLAGVGMRVEDLGVLPTPGAQVYAAAEDVPAIVITASHNPPEYNGMKLIEPGGVEADPDGYSEVEACFKSGGIDRAAWDDIGDRRTIPDSTERYVDALVTAVDAEPWADDPPTVAIDPGHGAGCEASPALFRRLGCEVRTVNAQPDGRFPGRDPEPLARHLGDLCRLVRVSEADLGIAHDGDADRAMFVDETGEPIPGDTVLAALASDRLDPGDRLVTAVNVSRRVDDAVAAAGGSVVRTPIGSTRIFAAVRELQADGVRVPIAGEGNGGIAFPEYRLARDGAFLGAAFLRLVVREPASAIAQRHGGYHLVRRRVEHDGETTGIMAAVEREARATGEDASLTTTDGFRLDYDDAWVLVRPSGTEPLVRIVAESTDPERARALADRFVAVVEADTQR